VLVHLRRSVVMALFCLVVFGLLYGLAGTGVAQVLFPHQADGSLTPRGSTLIGQNWAATRCPGHPDGSCVFQGRPDDLGPYASAKTNPAGHPGDDPLVADGQPGSSGATNLGPRSAKLKQYTEELVAYWHARGVAPTPDLVTTSGSGYDPDITPADARAEIPMVAAATGLSPASPRALIARQSSGPQLGFLGSPTVNVLKLNEALVALDRGR
jgi:potassium-transporting ATPase KdpC subunit